jgi:hypothetical protein
LYPDAADSLCLVQHIVVELPFHFVLLAGSESEYFLGNIIGMIILFIAGDKLVEQDNIAT